MRTSERDLRELIEQALNARKVSAIQAANAAGLNRDAVRSVLRGRSPGYGHLVEVCDAVGLDLIIRLPASHDDEQRPRRASTAGPTREHDTLGGFTATQLVSVRIAQEHGAWNTHISGGKAAAPRGLMDPHAFYVIAHDESLAPTGIHKGDHVLVSPNGRITRDTRIWLRRTDGRESLRWLAHWWAGGFETLQWTPPSGDENRPALNAEQVRLADITRLGAIVGGVRRRAVGHTPAGATGRVAVGSWKQNQPSPASRQPGREGSPPAHGDEPVTTTERARPERSDASEASRGCQRPAGVSPRPRG